MPTLESCRPINEDVVTPLPRAFARLRGFTLIEILVVLVIAGLIAGIALPRLFTLAQKFEQASQRDAILSDLGNLSYRAYSSGKPLVLGATGDLAKEAGLQPPPLSLPPHWVLEIPHPIHYAFNGVCVGGVIQLVAPNGMRETLKLQPPACKPEPQDSAP